MDCCEVGPCVVNWTLILFFIAIYVCIYIFRLLDMITQHFGSIAASTVRGFEAEKYPLILAVMKNRSALEVCSVLQGTSI